MGRLKNVYDFSGRAAAVTGGTGMLCSVLACALAECGAKVAVLGRNMEKAGRIVAEIRSQGGHAIPVRVDVTERSSIEAAGQQVMDAFGRVDILINGAGGARPDATTSNELSFFDLPQDALRYVFDLNCLGTIMCCQVFGRHMANQGSGSIINISSMGGFRCCAGDVRREFTVSRNSKTHFSDAAESGETAVNGDHRSVHKTSLVRY